MTPPDSIPPEFWDRFPPDFRPTRTPEPLGNAGGVSGSRLWRIKSATGPLMVRQWPQNGPDRDRLTRMHGWLAQLAVIPEVAAPLADRQGQTFQEVAGRFWEVTRFLDGQADLARPSTPAHLATMFATLARVHMVLEAEPTLAPSPGLIARRDELRQLLNGEFAHLRQALHRSPSSPSRAYALRWLDHAETISPLALRRLEPLIASVSRLQPALRDVRPDHFLFAGDRLTGLVDFGAMGVESVASDLARLLLEAVGADAVAWQSALAAYQSIHLLTTEESGLIRPFALASAVLGGARWVRWHFVEGRRFDDPYAVERGLCRAVQRLEGWPEL